MRSPGFFMGAFMMLSQHFDVRELVHPDIYNHPAIGDRAADFLHPGLVITLEQIKLHHGGDAVTVNNWHLGGSFINRGLRSAKQPYGAQLTYSAHYFGAACDTSLKSHTVAEVWANIVNHPDLYPYITRMEHISATPTWVHFEVGQRRQGDIVIFNP